MVPSKHTQPVTSTSPLFISEADKSQAANLTALNLAQDQLSHKLQLNPRISLVVLILRTSLSLVSTFQLVLLGPARMELTLPVAISVLWVLAPLMPV
jgi:hypothetical protein